MKLLRAIEHREGDPVGSGMPHHSDFRVIAATNRPLLDLVTRREFREDLYFRLKVFQIELPPLRDRREDILLLAEYFVRRIAPQKPKTLSAEAVAELSRRNWFGNVRELRNAVEHAAIVSRTDVVGIDSPPPSLPPPHRRRAGDVRLAEVVPRVVPQAGGRAPGDRRRGATHDAYLAETEPVLLEEAMEVCGGNRAATARLLGIHRATLREKLRRYHGSEEE